MICGGFSSVPRTLKAGLALLTVVGIAQGSITPAIAQTRPAIQVPIEQRSQSRAIVDQLLKQGRIIRSSQVRRGMRGIGRSVFQGIQTQDFPIVVLGVLQRVQGGGDIILIKVTGGPVVERNTGVISGMSGSPVYINGKLLGAISLGWGFPKEPICGVTPITEMIQTSLPDPARAHKSPASAVPATPPSVTPPSQPTAYRPKAPLHLGGRRIARVVVDRGNSRPPLSGPAGAATMALRPTTTLLQLSGYSAEALPKLRKLYAPYQIEPVIGPASIKTGVKPVFKPGAAIGVQLVSGDMDQTAIGTVTFRWGNRILAFGHRMFGQGATSLPMTTAFVQEIFPSYESSFKLASPVQVIGALQQDTQFAVGGTIGMKADTIPMTIALRERARQIDRTFRVRVMKDPVLTPQLIGSVASEAVRTTLGLSSNKMVRVDMKLEIDGAAPIVRRNYLYANGFVVQAALSDLDQSLSLTQMNEFGRGSVRRVDLSVNVEEGRRTATIKKLVANRNRLKAGETVQISVVLEPTDTPDKTVTRNFEFTVPKDAPTGAMRVGAAASVNYWPLQVRVGGPPPEPTNLRELIDAWNRVGTFNELMVQASTPRTFLKIDQQKVPNPAPSWAALLRATRSTDIASYNEVEVRRDMTEFVLSGAQVLSIPVEGARPSEKATPAPATTTGTTTPAASAPGEPKPVPAPVAPEAPGDPAGAVDEESTTAAAWLSALGLDQKEAATNLGTALNFELGASWSLSGNNEWLSRAPFLDQIDRLQEASAGAHRVGLTDSIPLQRNSKKPPARQEPVNPITSSVTSPTALPTPSITPTPTPSPAPTPTPTSAGKALARPASTWVQDNPAEFLQGEFEGTLVTSEGQLRLAPPSKLLATTAEPFVWSIAADTFGNTYLGTGNNGRIIRIDANGTETTFYDGPEVAITALTTDSAGNVYAGVTPGGRVYRFTRDGKRNIVQDTGADTFIWALEWDAQERLLIGTGGEQGNLYRIPSLAAINFSDKPDADEAAAAQKRAVQPFATVPQRHVRSIATRGSDLFIGTGDEGVLYRVDGQDGKVSALFQPGEGTAKAAAQIEITALAAAPDGVYFGTSQNGTLYRWTVDGGVVPVYTSPQKAIYSLRRTADGVLFAATGDQGIVYRIQPGAQPADTKVSRVLEPTQQQALALALVPGQAAGSGQLLIGTGNNGAAYRIGLNAAREGTFLSKVFDAKNIVQWGNLRTVGRGALIETRSGNTLDPDASWSEWQRAPQNDLGELRVASPPARYLQYRVRLTGPAIDAATSASNVDTTPALSRIEVVYRTQNTAPTVALSAPRGGEYWNGKKSVKWTGKDADGDQLGYRLSISSDDGKTWLPLTTETENDSSFDFDTTKWRDGTYRIRVVATDAVRNPEAPRQAEAISLPFTVDNTAPALGATSATATGNGTWQVQATATDAISPISGAEWSFIDDETRTAASTPGAATSGATEDDGNSTRANSSKDAEWQAAAAADSIFDSRRETIVAVIDAAAARAQTATAGGPGASAPATTIALERSLQLRVHDAAGNTAIVKIPLR